MMRMGYGYRRRRRPSDAEGHILPLINIVFLLLSFFLIAGQIAKKAPIPISPPVSESDAADRLNAATILIDGDGAATILTEPVTDAGLRGLMAEIGEDAQPLRIHADADAPANAVLRVLSSVRDAGWQRIELVTIRNAP